MLNLFLLILSHLLKIALLPIGLIYMVVRRLVTSPRNFIRLMSDTFLDMAIVNDQMGNVILRDLLQDVTTKGDAYQYGSPDETISRVLGKNKASNTLTKTGRLLADFLNFLDPNHVEKAANP